VAQKEAQMLVFYVVFFTLIVGALLWVTITGKDAWPFSSYKMFSARLDLNELTVYRVALEKHDGETVWWHSRFYRYPEFIGRNLKRVYEAKSADPRFPIAAALEARKHLLDVMRLISIEERCPNQYRAFHIVRRTAHVDDSNKIEINDEVISKVPMDTLSESMAASRA
jgi:hypothetical protein